VLQKLRSEGFASLADQATLVRYVGWGGLPQAFDHRQEHWRDEYEELSQLLSREEYEQARRSTQDAHYTPVAVVQGIYKGLERLGFSGGRVLEPACGTGHFMGLMPEAMRTASTVTAIELDSLTSEMARHLYPSATHLNRGFQDVVIPTGHFDAVVANPPFGTQTLYDAHHRELSSLSIHNYFLAKSIDTLREGGLMAVVVSRYFMDSAQASARELIGRQAHLLGAVRLPNTAFQQNALVQVTTDILFFKKRQAGEVPDLRWAGLASIRDPATGEPISISQYFCDHPQQMAGTMALTRKKHGDGADLLPIAGLDLGLAIEDRLSVLPQGVYRLAAFQAPQAFAQKSALVLPDHLKVGAFFVTPEGRLARRLPDVIDAHDYVYIDLKSERTTERIKAMVEVRDVLRRLMEAEQSVHSTDEALKQQRLNLNQSYDAFVKRFGHISSQANRLAMAQDPEYPLLHSLESHFDRGVSADMARKQGVQPSPPSAQKADIFTRRVVGPRQVIEFVETAQDALLVCMNECGRVDLARMARLTGTTEAQLTQALHGLIFELPDGVAWQPADQYLSGNVKAKLKAVEAAAADQPRFEANVQALRRVQPVDIEPVDIGVQLGSTWVPEQVVDAFVGHLLGDVPRRISFQEALGQWSVHIQRTETTLATVTWGTASCPAHDVITAILTNAPIVVRTVQGRDADGQPISKVDEAQTAAANHKADEVRQAFLDWVWANSERRQHLARIYNDRFNTHVSKRYDGAHLELPGSSLAVKLRPSQKNAIWRGIQEGSTLFDHVVGAGKTYVMAGVVMESRRMGLMNKAMLLVPNHLLLQWKDAFHELYPTAHVLVAEKSDFEKDKRQHLFARIATGQWDAVIVGHSSFKKIGMPHETLQEVLDAQVNDLSAAVQQLKEQGGNRLTIKELEKAKDRLRERMERKADAGAKDQAVSFADLGVDALLVDEAHEFKNLAITPHSGALQAWATWPVLTKRLICLSSAATCKRSKVGAACTLQRVHPSATRWPSSSPCSATCNTTT
jgi:N12 class adenine-specific DNA methylase/predicted RNA methylase